MLKIILLCIVMFTGYYAWSIFPIQHGPGVIAPDKPRVSRITLEKPFPFNNSTVVPIRKITAQVRVLEKKRYYFDNKSEYSPVDVLIGWNELSDERNLDYIHFSLDERYFKINYSKPPLPLNDIYSQIQLWHLMPSSEEIDTSIKGIREGNVISIEGFIVDIKSNDSFGWKSELTKPGEAHLKNTILWINSIEVR